MSEGFRIKRNWERVLPAVVAMARGLPVANLSDFMNRLSGASRMQRYHASGSMTGAAFTVRVRPGDNLLLQGAGHGRTGVTSLW